jgi:hypothetical protein
MAMRVLVTLILALGLGACSRAFGVLATLQDGRLVFVAESSRNECLLAVDVSSQLESAEALAANDLNPSGAKQVWSHQMWVASVEPDGECQNQMPVAYGVVLKGSSISSVAPQQLLPAIVYVVNIRTTDTGYGSGKFVIRPDGTIENLK